MHTNTNKVTLYRTLRGAVHMCSCCRDLELAFINIRMAFSQESFQELNQFVSQIKVDHKEPIAGCKRYCVYFRNFPLVLAFDYDEIIELKELLAEALIARELHDFLRSEKIDSPT